MKFEAVITVWDEYGDFKSRDRVVSDNTDGLKEEFEAAVDMIVIRLDKEAANKYKVGEDDDIPF